MKVHGVAQLWHQPWLVVHHDASHIHDTSDPLAYARTHCTAGVQTKLGRGMCVARMKESSDWGTVIFWGDMQIREPTTMVV